jgi:hypothetical protein
MKFLKSLFRNRSRVRAGIRDYVNSEFKPDDRQAVYERMVREAGL